MRHTKESIRSSSTITFIFLLLLATLTSLLLIYRIALNRDWGDAAFWAGSLRRLLLAVFLFYTAFIFRQIGRKESPFFSDLSTRMKVSAILLFAAFCLPQWIGYALTSTQTGALSFSVFDETTLIGFVLALAIFCFAQIFGYGFQLQDENDSIL